jgi:hypothetical protein
MEMAVFPDNVVLVSASDVWDTGVLTYSVSAQGVAVDDIRRWVRQGYSSFFPFGNYP